MTRLAKFTASIKADCPTTWQQIQETNTRANSWILFVKDKKDYWQTPEETLERAKGDCEDKAILKMFVLQALGHDARLVYCNTDGEGHMVCVVDDWILDSQEEWPLTFSESELKPARFIYYHQNNYKEDDYFIAESWTKGMLADKSENIWKQWESMLGRMGSGK